MNANKLETIQRKESSYSSIFSSLMKVTKMKSTAGQEMDIKNDHGVDDELYDFYNYNDDFSTPHLLLQHKNNHRSIQRSLVSYEDNQLEKTIDDSSSVFQRSIPYDNPSLLVEHIVPQSSLPPLLMDKGDDDDDMLVKDQFDQAIGSIFGVNRSSTSENDSWISIAYQYLLKNHVYMSMLDKQSCSIQTNNHTIRWTRVVLRVVIFLFITTLLYGYILPVNLLSMISVVNIMIMVTLTMIMSTPLILLFQYLLNLYCSHPPNFSWQTTYSTPGAPAADDGGSLRSNSSNSNERVDDDVHYDDLLSITDDEARRHVWIEYNSPEYTSMDSDERAVKKAAIQSIQQSIGMSSDGSPIPLSFMDWLQFGTRRNKLIAKIKCARHKADFIRRELNNVLIDENSKEIILIQLFILEQFNTKKNKTENVLSTQLYPSLLLLFLPSTVESSMISPISWCFAWLVIVVSIVFFFFFIIQWGLTPQGGDNITFWLWIMNFTLCLSIDLLVVQSIYTYAMYMLMVKSIIPRLEQIRHALLSNVAATISNKQNISNDIYAKCNNILSYLSPVYRSISGRSSRSPNVITTSSHVVHAILLSISDDVLLQQQCRDHNFNL